MEQEDGFLQAILEHPDDDVTRLVYADWLDDHGEGPRGEFIRLQVALARLPAKGDRAAGMDRRSRELLRKYGRRWFAPPRGWGLVSHVGVRRGFPESLQHTPRAFLRHAPDLFRRWPVTRLRLLGEEPAGLAPRLARMPFLARVRELNLYYMQAGADGILTWVGAFPRLVRLDLGCNNLTDRGLAGLARSCHLDAVQHLDLRHNGLSSAGVSDLARSEHARALRALSLGGNPAIVPGVLDLLRSDRQPALAELSLWYTHLGDAGLEQLAACPGLARLRTLNLTNNNLTDRGLAALAASPHARNLHTLMLALNQLSPASVDLLASSPHLHGLTCLNLYSNKGLRGQARRLRKRFGDNVSFKKPWTAPLRGGCREKR